MNGPRYLWFSPFAGLWPSFVLEHRLAQALADAGRTVTVVHCRGVLSDFCPVMSAQGLASRSPEGRRREICRDCRHGARAVADVSRYQVTEIDDAISMADREWAGALVASVGPGDWASLDVDGIPVGRYAAYLTMLNHKVPSVDASESSWSDYRADLLNSLLVLRALPRLVERTEASHLVVYNPLYPTNRMVAEYVRTHGLQLVGLHAGGYIPARYDTCGIYPHISSSQTVVDSPTISASLEVPCTPLEVRAVEAHLAELAAGTDPWVYSAAASRRPAAATRQLLGVRPDAPVMVALVSSPDETRSTTLVDAEYSRDPGRPVSDIPTFLRAVRQVALARPDVDVVIRIHPRLAPNKREAVTSPDLLTILAELENLPGNVVVNAPDAGLSLYDVLIVSSGAINHTSSAGLEFLALGLPVIQFDTARARIYPPAFSTCVEPGGDMAAAVDRILDDGWSLENARRAWRWYAVTLLRVLLFLGPVAETLRVDSAPADPGAARPAPAVPAPSPVLRAMRAVVPASVREAGARRLARRARARGLEPNQGAGGTWESEWIERLDETVGVGPVWRPPAIRRGAPGDETAAVAAAIANLLALLGVSDGPGVGAVRAALRPSTPTD